LGAPRNAKLRHVVGYDTVVTAGGTTGTLHAASLRKSEVRERGRGGERERERGGGGTLHAASVNMVLFMNTTLCARSTHARLQHKDNKARGVGTSLSHRQ
jgi:hypothetical protein